MTADVFTKPVTHEVFWRLLKEAGLAAVPMVEYRRYRHDKEQRKKHKEEKKAAKQLRVEKGVARKAGRQRLPLGTYQNHLQLHDRCVSGDRSYGRAAVLESWMSRAAR